jgi:hypothetical protein
VSILPLACGYARVFKDRAVHKNTSRATGRQLGDLSFIAGEQSASREGEDPWLCGPGFRRVCLYREAATLLIRRGASGVKASKMLCWRDILSSLQTNRRRTLAHRWESTSGICGPINLSVRKKRF